MVTEREPPLGVGLAGGGSGGGVCGLAVAGVGLPLDACGAEHHGYNYLLKAKHIKLILSNHQEFLKL